MCCPKGRYREIQMRQVIAVLLILSVGSANAALVARSGGDAFYDTVLDITWLADSNYALTNDFGIAGVSAATGQMDLATANLWIDELNTSNHLGINTWRLPVADPINGVSYLGSWSEDGSTDLARNLSASGSVYAGSTASEMAHLYFNTLGNISTRDVNGDETACFGGDCLSNTGQFSNLENVRYWTSSASPNVGEQLFFNFNGYQSDILPTEVSAVWVVATGDVLVPIPAAVWLFASGLGLLGWFRRRQTA
jgi:hypothetical protein